MGVDIFPSIHYYLKHRRRNQAPDKQVEKMFRVIDTNETPSLIVSKNANKSRAITEAANKYRNVPTVKLTVQKRNSAGKFETVGTFQSK